MDDAPRGGAEDRADLSGLGRLSQRPPPPRRERAAPLIRGISILLLAIAAAALPWYFLTKTDGGGGKAAAPPPPTSSTTASASPTSSPTGARRYEIIGVTACLRIRERPSITAGVVDCLNAGVRVDSDGRSETAEGRLWRYVYDPFKKAWGWAADEYLRSVS